MATKECRTISPDPTTFPGTMTALCAPELPAEVVCASDSADDQDFWEELGKPSSQGETGSTSRRVMAKVIRPCKSIFAQRPGISPGDEEAHLLCYEPAPDIQAAQLKAQMGPHCVWSNDSSTDMEALRLDFPDSFPPECAEDDLHDSTPEVPIPCMAQLLEKEIKANEGIPLTACRAPRTPCIGLPMALSCSDLTSPAFGVPCMIPSQPSTLPPAAPELAGPVCADVRVVESQPQASAQHLRPRNLQPGATVCRTSARGIERKSVVAPTAWRGCQKNPWCNRESRHRGVCNARAAAPGFTPAQEEPVCLNDLPKEELGSVKEQPSEGHNDSEQASATEVKCDGSGDAPQSARREGPQQEFLGVAMPVTPTVAPPCMPSQESLESCRSADSNMPREEDSRDAGDICSPHIPAAAVARCMPAFHFSHVMAPSTPRAGAAQRGPKRSIKSIAAPAAAVVQVPPVQEAAGEYRPEGLEVQVPQVAPGCVQLSSGRIARPTSKTAPSRASSAELSETFPGDDGKAMGTKRKAGRQGRASAEKAAKRRRMVGGILKTVGTAAPGQQCTQCGTQVTPVWRAGPYGPKTLCNACGVRYMKQVKKK